MYLKEMTKKRCVSLVKHRENFSERSLPNDIVSSAY
jgi:hypothetical protein